MVIRSIARKAFVLIALSTAVFIAYRFFSGMMAVAVFVGELLLLSLGVFTVRWFRYPGIFQSKKWFRLVWEVIAGAGALLVGTVVVWVARTRANEIAESEDFAYLLGMSFRFEKGSTVTVHYDAPKRFYPGESGNIRGVRVVARGDFTLESDPVGTVIYTVEFHNGVVLDVPESRLFQLPSAAD